MIRRLCGVSVSAVVAALSVGLSLWPSSGAAQGRPAKAAASKGGRSLAPYEKVPKGGQAAMTWPGLDLVGQIGSYAGGGTAKAPAYVPNSPTAADWRYRFPFPARLLPAGPAAMDLAHAPGAAEAYRAPVKRPLLLHQMMPRDVVPFVAS
ncbi:MAG: hypothetical protein NTW86_19600 [Candidatus Sumerlaeota bacterium]|nr:hypothetical protein [Candidatus Sumerlaeota bacterium]